MFSPLRKPLQELLRIVDDMLVGGDETAPSSAAAGPATGSAHPHRRAARVRIERRGGGVRPRAAHCLSPVPVRPSARRAVDRVI